MSVQSSTVASKQWRETRSAPAPCPVPPAHQNQAPYVTACISRYRSGLEQHRAAATISSLIVGGIKILW